MSASVIRLAERRPPETEAPRRDLAAQVAGRGYFAIYRHGEVNHCPGCGRSHWEVGRSSAECAFCGTALPFERPNPVEPSGGQNA